MGYQNFDTPYTTSNRRPLERKRNHSGNGRMLYKKSGPHGRVAYNHNTQEVEDTEEQINIIQTFQGRVKKSL